MINIHLTILRVTVKKRRENALGEMGIIIIYDPIPIRLALQRAPSPPSPPPPLSLHGLHPLRRDGRSSIDDQGVCPFSFSKSSSPKESWSCSKVSLTPLITTTYFLLRKPIRSAGFIKLKHPSSIDAVRDTDINTRSRPMQCRRKLLVAFDSLLYWIPLFSPSCPYKCGQ